MASPSHVLTFFLIFFTPSFAASLPSFPTLRLQANNTHSLSSIEHLIREIPDTDNYLDIYLNTDEPIDPVRFTNEIAEKYRLFAERLARGDDEPMEIIQPPADAEGFTFLVMPYTRARYGDKGDFKHQDFGIKDFVDVLNTLQRVLVQPKKFFETFWYLRNAHGVAFASGLIAAENPGRESWNHGGHH